MNGMKRIFVLALALLLAASLTACGGGSSGSDSSGATADYVTTDDAPRVPETEPGWAEESGGSSAANPALADAKIIYTADMELETREYDEATAALDRLVAEMGGYYESRSTYNYGTYRRASMTVRVPAENYRAFCDQAGEAAHRTRMTEDTQNVSEAYYDIEARLTTQRTKLERLQELLAQAESMEDIITLESALSDTELQIEYLTGSLRSYDALISFSTVTINLQEVYKISSEEEVPMTFGQRLGSAFSTGLRRGIDGAEDLLISFARNWVAVLVWIAVIAVVVTVVRRKKIGLPVLRKKRKAADEEKIEDQER